MSDYVLADDLSGALEAGASFRANGWRVILPLGDEQPPDGRADVLLVDSETRNDSPADAQAKVRALVRVQRERGSRLVFKKIDSTLRGPVGAEIAAVLAELGPVPVLFCPANPAAGRTVRGGLLRVHGVPLAATDFRKDPLWPARESRVAVVLAEQVGRPVAQLALKEVRKGRAAAAAAIQERVRAGNSVIVGDAETDQDLSLLVEAAHDAADPVLLVGSGALGAVVASSLKPGRAATAPPLPMIHTMIVLCGSRHPASQRQLAYLAEHAGVEVIEVMAGKDSAADVVDRMQHQLASRGVVAVKFDAKAAVPAEAARKLLGAVNALTSELASRVSPGAYFLTGGETAWTVCHTMGGKFIEIIAEAEPGVVVSRLIRKEGEPVIIVTKPGGFGVENTISRLIGRP